MKTIIKFITVLIVVSSSAYFMDKRNPDLSAEDLEYIRQAEVHRSYEYKIRRVGGCLDLRRLFEDAIAEKEKETETEE